jgi:parallel beta-helix repeat protein
MGTVSKSFALVLVALFLTSLVLMPHATVKAQSKTIAVPDDYPTIQSAIGNSSTGDTIFVRAGNYSVLGYDGILIDKSISLVGENSQNTVITVGQYRYARDAIHITADNVTVSGFYIDGGGIQMGIDVEDSYSHVPIGCKIIGNSIHNCGVAIDAYGSTSTLTGQIKYLPSYLTISGNILSGNDRGIYMSASNSTVSGNIIDSNRDLGMIVDDCVFLNVYNNTISNNGLDPYDGNGTGGGIWLRWWGPFYINRNIVTGNHGYGIGFEEFCNNSTVWGNEISNNDFGIREYLVQDGGSGNVVYENNFIDNQRQVAVNQTLYSAVKVSQVDVVALDNGKVGNYWSDYKGSGVYMVDENNIDHYPLNQQVDISKTVSTPSNYPSTTPTVPEFSSRTISLLLSIVLATAGLLVYHKRKTKTV